MPGIPIPRLTKQGAVIQRREFKVIHAVTPAEFEKALNAAAELEDWTLTHFAVATIPNGTGAHFTAVMERDA